MYTDYKDCIAKVMVSEEEIDKAVTRIAYEIEEDFKNSDKKYKATMDNISANGFAFLVTDEVFAQSKGREITITINDFALQNHNVLEGRIIRCSDDNGLYIVGCQMPEDDFYIYDYVEQNMQ